MPKPKAKPKAQGQAASSKEIERLLTQQTTVILNAVDERLSTQDKGIADRFAGQDKWLKEQFVAQNIAILSAVDKRIEKFENVFREELSRLTNTLDKFLKRVSDIEEEFTFMKHDINRIKAVMREKLGVSIQ